MRFGFPNENINYVDLMISLDNLLRKWLIFIADLTFDGPSVEENESFLVGILSYLNLMD